MKIRKMKIAEDKKQKLEELLSRAEPGMRLWTIRRKDLFQMHYDISNEKYFGMYEMSSSHWNGNEEYYVLNGESPKVWTPVELLFFGEMSNEYCEGDRCYVFRDSEKVPVYYVPNKYYEEPFKDELFHLHKLFRCIGWQDLHLTKEDAIEACKELNTRDSEMIYLMELGKTLDSMKRQLDAFVKNDYVVKNTEGEDEQ